MKHRILPIALAALFLAGASKAVSAPPLINYQGRVAVGTPAVNFHGTGQFKFALVDATGGVTYWSNDGSSVGGSEPTAGVPLTVTKGLYSVLLGDTPLMNPLIGPAIFSQPDLRLRVWFSDNTPTGFQLLSPDQRLAPTAYLADGAVTSTNIAPGAVNSANIAPYAIRAEHFFPGSLDFSILQVRSPGPAPGQVLSFDGGSMVWTDPGGGAFALNGTNAYYNGGNVGIGTDTPGFKFVIYEPGLVQTAISGAYIRLGYLGENGSNLNGGELNVQGGWATNDGGRIRLGGSGRVDADRNVVQFMQNGAERMRINEGGNVGIDSSNPAAKLEVASLDGNLLRLIGAQPHLTLYDSTTGYAGSRILATGGDLFFLTQSFLQNSNPYSLMKIANSGNVGIGSSNPAGKLEVATLDGNVLRLIGYQPYLTLYDSNAGYPGSRIQAVNGALIFETQSYIASGPNNHYARLDANGNFSVRMLTIRGGADLAEPFEMKEEELEKGSVVVIDDEHPGRLKRSASAYDTRVAGIVSGANGINPGIALHQEGVLDGGQNVALSGRVYVQADATNGPIKPGDLLTTSDTPGHAMKVTEPIRAQGAVIGKAMSSLAEGTGMVLVLVTLQ